MDPTFIEARITATKASIVAAEDAELALLGGGIQTYTIDTGQTRQTVTKANITELRNYIDSLYNRLVTLQARLTGGGVVNVGPAY